MSDLLERLRRGWESWDGDAAVEAADRIAALEAENARLREALERWRSYGCPDCGGDCASANPPVNLCIMRETYAALGDDA